MGRQRAADLETFWLVLKAQALFGHLQQTVLLSQGTTLFLLLILATTVGVPQQRLGLTLASCTFSLFLGYPASCLRSSPKRFFFNLGKNKTKHGVAETN